MSDSPLVSVDFLYLYLCDWVFEHVSCFSLIVSECSVHIRCAGDRLVSADSLDSIQSRRDCSSVARVSFVAASPGLRWLSGRDSQFARLLRLVPLRIHLRDILEPLLQVM